MYGHTAVNPTNNKVQTTDGHRVKYTSLVVGLTAHCHSALLMHHHPETLNMASLINSRHESVVGWALCGCRRSPLLTFLALLDNL